jgi:lipopolysaccharide/colanic/teichoic acid biosynthesis glycosyltransferase
MNWGNLERGKVLLLAGDFVLAAAAMILATILHAGMPLSLPRRTGLVAVFMLVYTICFYVFDLYDVQAINGTSTLMRLLAAAVSGTCALVSLLYLFQWPGYSRSTMGISVPFLVVSSFAWRKFYKKHRSSSFKRRSVLLIGTPEDAMNLHAILKGEYSRYEFCGFLRFQSSAASVEPIALFESPAPLIAAAAAVGTYKSHLTITLEEAPSLPYWQAPHESYTEGSGIQDFGVANMGRLEEIALHLRVHMIVIRQDSSVTELAESLTRLRFQGILISSMPDLCSHILGELPLDTLSDMWFSFATGFNSLHERVFRRIKRLADILMACVGLSVTLPISAVVAIAIKLESPGPVLFRQWRVGWMEIPFNILKFRSMQQDAESDGKPRWANVADSRVTRVGRILRRSHIDEIPQMINVLLGEMSFVGPRPERPAFVEQLKQLVPFYHLRHHLPPGITGWAQVNYPYGASVEDAKRKLQYDLFYVRYASPTMDLRILLRTARVILFRRGSR